MTQSISSRGVVDTEIIAFVSDNYGDDVDVEAIQAERNVVEAILHDTMTFFTEIYKEIKELGQGQNILFLL